MTTPVDEKEKPDVLPAPPADEIVELQQAAISFRFDGSRLKMRPQDDERWYEVSLSRLFPLSEPEQWISVANSEGKEVGVLLDLHGLSRENYAIVQEALRRRYLVPQIIRITACRDRFDLTEWDLETDRGSITILLRHPQENIKQTLPGRFSLTDVEGNRYDIPDLDGLDRESRAWLELRL